MRRADRWLGLPACLALTALRALADRLRPRTPGPPKSILLVKLAEQGSTVLAWPALVRAVERVGRRNVYFMVFRDNRFILDAMDVLEPENVLEIDTRSLASAVRGAVRALRRARAAGVDAAIDLEFFARSSAALCYLSGAAARVGFHAGGGGGPWRGDLMTHRLSYNPHLHTSRMFLAMVEALAAPPEQFPAFDLVPPAADGPLPHFTPRPEEIEEVRGIVRRAAGRDAVGPLILLNPNAGDLLPLRRWP
ncbi:MAG: glycosyltransferase family 9 protein, partial [Planctomycetes bacterium]|nr:glycosyltransferase family 9 protein [Planctomycetota bacterium]